MMRRISRRSLLCGSLGMGALGRVFAQGPGHRGFEGVAGVSGVNFRHAAGKTGQKYLLESMGSGVAMLDYNNDGWLDLFFVNGAALRDPMPPGARPDKSHPRYWNRLYRNNGN